MTVTPGEPSRITSAEIEVTGPAVADAPLGTEAVAKLKEEWGLPLGEIFRQTAWTSAKDKALSTLRASPYASAKIERSEAAIDPDAHAAALTVEIASGPAFEFGDIVIEGLVKYPESIVRNYSPIHKGEPFSDSALETFIRRLNSTGYFSSVQATIDTESTHPEDATLRVSVVEAQTKSFEGGIGYSTDVRYIAKASYRDVNVDNRALQMNIDARLESKLQNASLRFVRPPSASGWSAPGVPA
jgi:translocation and assembly module TamA